MAKKASKKASKKAAKKVVKKTKKPTKQVRTTKFKVISEFRKLLPKLTPEEFKALEESIDREGLREPLVIWKEKGILVDGHNRRDICKNLKIKPVTREQSFNSKEAVKLWILDNQAGRRNMTTFQRIEATLALKDAIAAEVKKNQQAGGGAVRKKVYKPKRTDKILGDKVGVSHVIIRKAEAILAKHGNGEIDEKVMNALRSGKTKISSVYNLYCKDKKAGKHSDKDLSERSNGIIRLLKMQVARSFSRTKDRTSLYDKIIEWANVQKAGLEEPSE